MWHLYTLIYMWHIYMSIYMNLAQVYAYYTSMWHVYMLIYKKWRVYTYVHVCDKCICLYTCQDSYQIVKEDKGVNHNTNNHVYIIIDTFVLLVFWDLLIDLVFIVIAHQIITSLNPAEYNNNSCTKKQRDETEQNYAENFKTTIKE